MRFYYILGVGGSLVAGFLLLYFGKLHYHFAFQYIPGFFAICGFAFCAVLILGAKLIGIWLVRPVDYYEKRRRR
jgi:hypothetical protein